MLVGEVPFGAIVLVAAMRALAPLLIASVSDNFVLDLRQYPHQLNVR